MPKSDDPHVFLLRHDPHRLVLEYQEPIRKTVLGFISRGGFASESLEDVVQSVNEQLLRRMGNIQKQYDGSVLLRTYLGQIIRNICLSLIKGKHFGRGFQELREESEPEAAPVPDRYSLRKAQRLFEAILEQFGGHKPKLLICLKLRFRISLTAEDLLLWFPECDQESIARVLADFGGDFHTLTEGAIFALIAPIFNRAEGKQNTPDALRKWVSEKLSDIIELLNGHPPVRAFSKETIEILLQDYFSPFLMDE